MLVRMKSARAFPYHGRDLAKNKEFDAASESDARVFEIVGHASRVTEGGATAPAAAPAKAEPKGKKQQKAKAAA